MCLEEEDYRIVEANYRGRRLYRALLGTEEFARCFITAEYLYTIFGEGFHFDYTSVVSGYLKCIEQLVYKIVLINLKYHSEDESYERFYRKMIEIPRGHVFRIQFAGEEPLILHRLLKQDDPIYDENGSLVKSTIKFVREESYTEESEDGGRADVTIDAAHIPQNVWLLTGAGSKEIKNRMVIF